jgi:SAM-dependent methyltransferase
MFIDKWNFNKPSDWGISSSVHLDIGCGTSPRNPFKASKLIGADVLSPSFFEDIQVDEYFQVSTGSSLPFQNASLDSISGFDFLEHLDRSPSEQQNDFIFFMNEAHRVLVMGGHLLLVTPAYPSPAVFQDPTHVNFITEKTVEYFLGTNPPAKSLGYGFHGSFSLVAQTWVGPFSKVFDRSAKFENGNVDISIAKLGLGLKNLRGKLSTLRNPTHLLWLLQKI